MTIILPGSAKDARKKERTIRPSKPSRSVRRNYQDALEDQVRFLKAQTAALSDLISSGADRAAAARTLAAMSADSRARAARLAPLMAESFVTAVSQQNKASIEKSIASALSVDFATIVDSLEVAGSLELAVTENVALITSISEQHFAEVGRAVLDNYRGTPLVGDLSLTKRLQQLGGITQNRAKFIARDQTAKLTGDLNQLRQQDNGIDEYIWRTARDQRVVGTPGGTYPKGTRGHENHYVREGKTFKWSEPPEDGHPGHAYNCRCYAAPVMNLEKIKAQYV